MKCKKCNGTGHMYILVPTGETSNAMISFSGPIITHCDECKGSGNVISPEDVKEIELHNSIRQLISDYIGEGVDNNMRECVDEIIKLLKEE